MQEEESARDAAHRLEEAELADRREPFQKIASALASGWKNGEPLADSYGPDGKPLLSWRVHLLPRLGEQKLYQRFKRNEPWDSPANKKLLQLTPGVYVRPHPHVGEWMPGWTHVRGFSQPGAVFEPRVPFALKDLTSGPDHTLAFFESAEPVEWTRPDQLDWRDPKVKPRAGGSPAGSNQFLAAMASGRVVWIDRGHSRRCSSSNIQPSARPPVGPAGKRVGALIPAESSNTSVTRA